MSPIDRREAPNAVNKLQAPSQSSCSKKEKGRLKKLQKRASCLKGNCSISGISTDPDWKELQNLYQQHHRTTCSVPVQVRWKDNKARTNIEAASHRELLLRFTRTITTDASPIEPVAPSKKKRKRDDAKEDTETSAERTGESADSYGWACLHNPAVVSHVAVIELDIDNGEAAEWLGQHIVSEKLLGERSVVAVPTKWFQDSQKQPQSMSNVLMYKAFPPKGDDDGKTKPPTEHAPTSMDDLVSLLEPLVMTPEQLEREGYPHARKTGHSAEMEQRIEGFRSKPDTFVRPREIPLIDALALVQHFQVPTESTSGEQLEKQLPPFVVAFSPLDTTTVKQQRRRIFAMDCEMVETNQGLELARVTLCQLASFGKGGTDVETDLVFDTLVRPQNTVLNYLTQYSGMTAAILGNKDDQNIVRLEQVQAALLATIRPDDIVVGHSLENDLRATRWVHTTVIDTALLFRSKNRPSKFSLRHLAASLLDKQIQKSDGPHCSEEDALTALQLAVRRAVQGPSFRISGRPCPTNWLAELSKKATAVCVGPCDWLHRHVLSSMNAVHALQCASVHDSNGKAVASWLAGPKRRASIVWARFGLRTTPTDPSLVHRQDTNRLEQLLKDLLAKLPPQAVILMAIQPGFEKADKLSQSRRIRQNPRATVPWSEQEEEEWNLAVRACQSGVVLWVGGSLAATGCDNSTKTDGYE